MLREIAELAIRPFLDETLERRVEAAQQSWRRQLAEQMDQDPRVGVIHAAMSAALRRVDAAAAEVRSLQRTAEAELTEVSPPPFTLPKAVITETVPKPLFSTADDYVTATQRLRAHKALDAAYE